ncbi:MAG: phosphoribosyltransferase [Vulcanimicrobiota bacterium]
MDRNELLDSGEMGISWDDLGKLCIDLAQKIHNEFDPDIVVGIVKAGVLPGVIISSLLNKDFYTIKLSRKVKNRIVHARPILFVPITESVYNKKVLLIDEFAVSGETIKMAEEEIISKQASQVKTATLFANKEGYRPDWFVVDTAKKIVNPWDKYILDRKGELQMNPELEM